MKQHKFLRCVAAGLACLSVTPALTAEDEHEEHGAHEHGAAILNVALDGAQLVIELETPAVNIVGFEHKPGDEAQEQAVKTAAAMLADGSKAFGFSPSAGCSQSEVEVESALLAEHDEHEDEHEHDDDHAGDETHSEFHVVYGFTCNGEALRHIDVNLFSLFPGIEEIEARAVTPSGQKSRELTANSTRIDL